jgi:hypothetical protein
MAKWRQWRQSGEISRNGAGTVAAAKSRFRAISAAKARAWHAPVAAGGA